MRRLAAPTPSFLSRRQLALIAAALLTLGPAAGPAAAQGSLAALQARADEGDPSALNTLGNAYANGQGVARD